MKTKIFEKIEITTPRGDATIKRYIWESNNKELEKELNEEFGINSKIITHEQITFGVAIYILADQAVQKFGGDIIKIHKKTITIKKSKEIVV
jgi:hypothetical protein